MDSPGGELFEFLFDVTGGSLAIDFLNLVGDSVGGVILDAGDSGFNGSFLTGFMNSGFTGVADIAIPEPATMALILIGLAALAPRRTS